MPLPACLRRPAGKDTYWLLLLVSTAGFRPVSRPGGAVIQRGADGDRGGPSHIVLTCWPS
ncbi:hypothetical protein FRAHR75_120131 [Frankia sp. Hr75.2]|nr:hypothetical protein FRAHR75_120131 [Frankia sp. Hr75.2]